MNASPVHDPVVGVDACPGGWVAVRWDADGSTSAEVWAGFGQLLRATDVSVVCVDIPIGLPTSGSRPSDVLARRRIGPRRSSVFPAPLRATLDVESYAEARAVSRAIHGKALSAQAWALLPKIREVQTAIEQGTTATVVEVHPEVSFAAMAGDVLHHSKHGAQGLAAREALLRLAGITPPACPRHAAADDLLDACAAAWSARRVALGTAERLPADPSNQPAPAIWV